MSKALYKTNPELPSVGKITKGDQGLKGKVVKKNIEGTDGVAYQPIE